MTSTRRSPEEARHAGNRTITLVGAPSSIGIRPYDHGGEARGLDRAPRVLRDLGLASRLGAQDLGDEQPPPYSDFDPPPAKPRNEQEIVAYSRALADRVATALEGGRLGLVLGGDCSIVLGCVLGARRRSGRVGLVYVDAHADFATPEESPTGSAASMCLALATGRGDSPLATLVGAEPLVRAQDTVLIGRRDLAQVYFSQAALSASGILDLPDSALSELGGPAVAARALERVGGPDLAGFWIHVDADVLDPRRMPAVDSPEPGGPGPAELAALLAPLAAHPGALGIQVTIYDPTLDEDGACAALLVTLLEDVLAAPQLRPASRASNASPKRRGAWS